MAQFKLDAIPYEIEWINHPLSWKVGIEEGFTIQAGENTDWFADPSGNSLKDDAPRAGFTPTDGAFLMSVKLFVDFQSAFDAGGLFVQVQHDLWAKVCFECSKEMKPNIISVVTRGLSDDCISMEIEGREVFLRLAYTEKIIAFFYSADEHYWQLVRYFTLGEQKNIKAGLLSQSPTGHGCWVRFSNINYSLGSLKDYRSGE